MSEAKYKRVLLKLSGEALAGAQKTGVNPEVVGKICDKIKEVVDFIISKELMSIGNPENLIRLFKEIVKKDWFMALLDLEDYTKTKEEAFKEYEDRQNWAKKMLINISKAGYFSSDRTIEEYNRDIWKLQ